MKETTKLKGEGQLRLREIGLDGFAYIVTMLTVAPTRTVLSRRREAGTSAIMV